MDNDITRTFARFASELACDDIPHRVRDRSKDLLLDALACALAGYEGEDTPKVIRFAATLGQSQESSIIGGGRLSLTGATALNGFLITAVSMCDVYRPTATHLQPVVVPPALAIAEREEPAAATCWWRWPRASRRPRASAPVSTIGPSGSGAGMDPA